MGPPACDPPPPGGRGPRPDSQGGRARPGPPACQAGGGIERCPPQHGHHVCTIVEANVAPVLCSRGGAYTSGRPRKIGWRCADMRE
eukprot:8365847-Pyramimonas_sp.AAC.1